jgi:hypothetical protein
MDGSDDGVYVVGNNDGEKDGKVLGIILGILEGMSDGLSLGIEDGAVVGLNVGMSDGDNVGMTVGDIVGRSVKKLVSTKDLDMFQYQSNGRYQYNILPYSCINDHRLPTLDDQNRYRYRIVHQRRDNILVGRTNQIS